jgi:membrane protein
VLLADPGQTRAAPLIDRLLLAPTPEVQAFRTQAGVDGMTLAALIPAA